MRVLTGVLALALAACATPEPDPPTTASRPAGAASKEASIVNNDGAEIGQARFTAAPEGVLIRLLIEPGGLTAGWHGAHLHMVGDCSDTDTFERAGDHIEKTDSEHGLLHGRGPENGDLPNISVTGDGSASVEIYSTRIAFAGLQDSDGSALVIHAEPDDHITQPIGNSGDRVACAVVPR